MLRPVFLMLDRGAIGLSACPGRDAPLALDSDIVAAQGVAMVVSLIEATEAPDTIRELPGLLDRHGIGWRHFPIEDYGVPRGAAWPALAGALHQVLDEGGRILLHCWGGKGRSGMIALRLMIERGETSGAALERLRALRPGAVETDAQRAWAEAGQRSTQAIA